MLAGLRAVDVEGIEEAVTGLGVPSAARMDEADRQWIGPGIRWIQVRHRPAQGRDDGLGLAASVAVQQEASVLARVGRETGLLVLVGWADDLPALAGQCLDGGDDGGMGHISAAT